MRRATAAWALVACLSVSAPAAFAQGPRVDHSAVGCLLADRFPRIEARVESADAVSRASVYFRATGSEAWYFVEMKAAGAVFQGTLPKPKRATKSVDYYIEALDSAFRDSRTPEHRPLVVGNAAECRRELADGDDAGERKGRARRGRGHAGGASGLRERGRGGRGSATGAASATSAGGGGLSAGAIAAVVGGGAAVAAGVAVAAGGGGDGEGSTGGASGSAPKLFTVRFGTTPVQALDVSVCAGRNLPWTSQVISIQPDGSFNNVWSPGEPNTLRITGRADTTRLDATLACVSGAGPTGSITATGNGTSYSGTFSFGSSQGPVTITRQ